METVFNTKPGAEEGVLDERGHVARQVLQVLRQGVDVRAAFQAGAEGGRATGARFNRHFSDVPKPVPNYVGSCETCLIFVVPYY